MNLMSRPKSEALRSWRIKAPVSSTSLGCMPSLVPSNMPRNICVKNVRPNFGWQSLSSDTSKICPSTFSFTVPFSASGTISASILTKWECVGLQFVPVVSRIFYRCGPTGLLSTRGPFLSRSTFVCAQVGWVFRSLVAFTMRRYLVRVTFGSSDLECLDEIRILCKESTNNNVYWLKQRFRTGYGDESVI